MTLHALAPNLWHAQHQFSVFGIQASSRMTVVRFANGQLWLHSPIRLTPELQAAVNTLGEVTWLVAPSKMHHLFVGDWQQAFPQAKLYGPRGLARKRPDLTTLQPLAEQALPEWADELLQLPIRGIPAMGESVWLHRASETLILTDLCMWIMGDIPASSRAYASLMGVRKAPNVSRLVRFVTRDKPAARDSVRQMLQWPISRVILAHNTVLEQDAKATLLQALSWFER